MRRAAEVFGGTHRAAGPLRVGGRRRRAVCVAALLALGLAVVGSAFGQPEPPQAEPPQPVTAPQVDAQTVPVDAVRSLLTAAEDAADPDRVSGTLLLFLLLTVLSLAPAILVMTTSFTRVIVVLGFLRQAMATQQSPPNQVLVGLALFLTFFIMAPTYQQVYDEAVAPYMNRQLGSQEALDAGLRPIRAFMFRQVREKDVALFLDISGAEQPDTEDDVPTLVLMPAFVISELRIAFQIGFIIYIPFLIIDMVVASTLMAMGMMMLPPVFVSLPFKIIMFVLADGWYLLVEEMVAGFGGG